MERGDNEMVCEWKASRMERAVKGNGCESKV